MAKKISERLTLFYESLNAAPPAASHDEAFDLLGRLLDQIEDAHSGVPADPEAALTGPSDGRMYPPHSHYRRPVREGLVRYRTKGHNVYIADNGAIQIRTLSGQIDVSRAGADGEGVGEV
ncbi:MAG: hypothetical protein ACRC33_06110 [Gemmataceae bacterium]